MRNYIAPGVDIGCEVQGCGREKYHRASLCGYHQKKQRDRLSRHRARRRASGLCRCGQPLEHLGLKRCLDCSLPATESAELRAMLEERASRSPDPPLPPHLLELKSQRWKGKENVTDDDLLWPRILRKLGILPKPYRGRRIVLICSRAKTLPFSWHESQKRSTATLPAVFPQVLPEVWQ
jgi:hypothetical protein